MSDKTVEVQTEWYHLRKDLDGQTYLICERFVSVSQSHRDITGVAVYELVDGKAVPVIREQVDHELLREIVYCAGWYELLEGVDEIEWPEFEAAADDLSGWSDLSTGEAMRLFQEAASSLGFIPREA